tara:strand:+ start:279 stop:563 length:285 start_codon:yes stop_codon:yes gene_type:complete
MFKKMTPIWYAHRIKSGDDVYIKTMPTICDKIEKCLPHPEGSILCKGSILSVGIDSEWDSLVKVRFRDPILNSDTDIIISEDEKEYRDCFYVER